MVVLLRAPRGSVAEPAGVLPGVLPSASEAAVVLLEVLLTQRVLVGVPRVVPGSVPAPAQIIVPAALMESVVEAVRWRVVVVPVVQSG